MPELSNTLLLIAGVYVLMSAVTFFMFWRDKRLAKRGAWRTPEKTLLTLAFLGGWPGAMLAMKLVRHKTKTPKFVFGVPAIAVIHGLGIGYLIWSLITG